MVRTLRAVLPILLVASTPAAFPPAIDLAQTPADVTILGAASYEYAGAGFTSGDYNGDGLVDLVVLSWGSLATDGYTYFHIFWGGSPLPNAIDLATYSENVSYVRAMPGDDGFWAKIESGDFNGDGIDDLALGVPCTGFNCTGKVYVIFGTPSFPDTLDLRSPTVAVVTVYGVPGGPGFGGFMGYALAAGDVNGDSIDDLVMGAPEFGVGGHVYILWGRPVSLPTVELASPVAPVTRLIDPRYYSKSGTGLACGDANNDGFVDVLVGGSFSKEVILVLGAPTLPDTVLLDAPPAKRFIDAGGWRVRLADFNGDGYDDLVTASLHTSSPGCVECGRVTIAFGGPELPDETVVSAPDAAVVRLMGTPPGTSYGTDLAVGDPNGDGYADILVSNAPDNYDTADVGKVTIVYGSAAPPDTVLLGTDTGVTRILAESRPDAFGYALLSRDINGDGVDDVIVGAYRGEAAGRIAAGKAYVLFGERDAAAAAVTPRWAGRLGQNYPNPFNPVTFIPVSLSRPEGITLRIHDVRGGRIRTLLDRRLEAGEHRIPWDGSDDSGRPLASGVYFYRLSGRSFAETRKLLLLR